MQINKYSKEVSSMERQENLSSLSMVLQIKKLTFHMSLMYVVTCLLLVVLTTSTSLTSSPQLALPPITAQIKLTPSLILSHNPALKMYLRPQTLAYHLLRLPYGLRSTLQILTFTIIRGRAMANCMGMACPFDSQLLTLVRRYVKVRGLQTGFLVFFARDEIHERNIREWMERTNPEIKKNQQEADRLIEHYKHIIKTLPAFLMSIDLKSELQNTKFLIPDAWMLFKDFRQARRQAQQASKMYPWQTKVNQVFWRGADSGHTFDYVDIYSNIAEYFPRLELVRLSRDNPQKIDARFTAVDQQRAYQYNSMNLNLISEDVSVKNHVRFKYLASLDGWTAAWLRPCWIMASNSLLLKQESNKVEWFYWNLIPYKHYIPVKHDLSDLLETFQYLEKNQQKIPDLIKEANQFVEDHLSLAKAEQDFFFIMDDYFANQNVTFSVMEYILSDLAMLSVQKFFDSVYNLYSDEDRAIFLGPNRKNFCQMHREKVKYTKINNILKIGTLVFMLYFAVRLISIIKRKNLYGKLKKSTELIINKLTTQSYDKVIQNT